MAVPVKERRDVRYAEHVRVGEQVVREPRTRVVREALGDPALDTLVVMPEHPRGLVLYCTGFNTPLQTVEALKCQLLADASGSVVVDAELPGVSRHGRPLPPTVRRQLRAGDSRGWSELWLGYLDRALEASGIRRGGPVHLVGYSTGCSLATHAVAALGADYQVASLTLIEPVAILSRSTQRFRLDYLSELANVPATVATNSGIQWAMDAWREHRRCPGVSVDPADLEAIKSLLATSEIATLLEDVTLPCHLVRGAHSRLTPRRAFDAIALRLEHRHVSGSTLTIDAMGHVLWNSFPAVTAIGARLWGASINTPGRLP